MIGRPRPALFAFVVALLMLIAFVPHAAEARTFPAKTVWFGTQVLGPGDIVNGDLDVIFGDVVCDGGTVTGDVRVFWGSFDAPRCLVGGEASEVLSQDWPSMVPVIPWARRLRCPSKHRIAIFFRATRL